MSFNYNHCTLMGRLTRDPEFRQVTENFCKLNFILAIARKFRREKTETDFIPVSILGNNAAIGKHLLFKGTPVLIWGTVQVRNYEKDNERKWITEVIAENFQLLDKIKRKKEGEMDLHFDEIEKMEVVNK
ncbi:single-stranded DNA-binding protein [Candidatus Marinamargulisbacteria bacterium SCGC AG-343-D04]|nr:single-stranded DNA-binding protein [Candidatus Marinamargulisbacteria bacterium SCGC AG-343-D04]